MNIKEFITSIAGTSLSAIGTVAQTHEVLEIISMIITIIGAIISFIVVPVISWYKNATKDGKITTSEIKDGVDIIKEGVDDIKEITKKEDKKDEEN